MSPRNPDRSATMRSASREKLLDAALALFARDGVARTSVRAIAERAGVAVGLLYNYFEGKDALLAALFERGMEGVRASFAHAEAGTTPADRLVRLLRGGAELIERNHDFWSVLYALRAQPGALAALPDELGGWAETIHQRLRSVLADLGHPDPERHAWLLYFAFDNLVQHRTLAPGVLDYDAMLDALIASYLPSGDAP
jgi:AcrR family transcriptional regulator